VVLNIWFEHDPTFGNAIVQWNACNISSFKGKLLGNTITMITNLQVMHVSRGPASGICQWKELWTSLVPQLSHLADHILG
jgi:hypothetical protein